MLLPLKYLSKLCLKKINSCNVCDSNETNKRAIIKGCLVKWKQNIVCLLETKMECMPNSLKHVLPKSREFRWRDSWLGQLVEFLFCGIIEILRW